MGHTNADVTLNVYTQVMDDSLRVAVDRVGAGLFSAEDAKNKLFTNVHAPEGPTELTD